MLKERTTYEIMNPTDVGWEGTRLVLGKHSGRAGFRNTLQEIGMRLDEDQLNEAYQRFLALADRKKAVTAADLVALVSDQLEVADDPLQLVRWNASIGSGGPATGERGRQSTRAPRLAATARATAPSTRSFRPSTRRWQSPASSRSTTSRRSRLAKMPRDRCDCGSAPATRSSPATDSPRTSSRRVRGRIWRR